MILSYDGEHYIIQRGGKPIAFMGPVEESRKERTLKELNGLLERLPKLGKEAATFERDIEEVRSRQPTLSAGEEWA
ncbi:MAG: hypothetical protein HY266_03740 [Deltaproteobacteria bacterium]|nr:hypothetical protein [Deltaproteobacteria bacterium]